MLGWSLRKFPMGFKRRPTKNRLALEILNTEAGQRLIQERLAGIDSELSDLEAQRMQLAKEQQQLTALMRKGGRSSNGVKKRRRRNSISTERVVGAIGELMESGGKPPTRAAIASHLHASDRDRLVRPLEALIQEGVVQRVGKGRGTAYRLT